MRRLLTVSWMSLLMVGFFFISETRAAEEYPVKPITFIVAVDAGGAGDILARPIVQSASSMLGKPIFVVNKPGAGSSIGYRELHDARPDGYTIGWASATLITNKLQGLLPYDYHEYTLIGAYATNVPAVVASTKTKRPFAKIEEVFAFAKAHPGEVSVSTGAVGQSWWIAMKALEEGSGLKFNIVPQGGADALSITQVAGGHTDLAVVAIQTAKAQVEAGNVRILATFGSTRIPGAYAHIPCLKEAGYEIKYYSTQIVLGPARMRKDITDKLVKVVEKAANEPEYKKFLVERNAIPLYLNPEQTLKHYEEQTVMYRQILGSAGLLKEMKK